jgi:outer membrane protein OmpA-like peptidoglycan-associated protein
MYFAETPLTEQSDTEAGRPRRPLSYREAITLADRKLLDEYNRACQGVTVLQFLRRGTTEFPADPVLFWEKVISWLPGLFKDKREAEQLVREGRLSPTDKIELIRFKMNKVFPPGYKLGTEAEELARARCALAEERWRSQAKTAPRPGPIPSPWSGSTATTGRRLGEYGFAESWRARQLTPKPAYLRFLTLDGFIHDSSSLTDPLRDKVRYLARLIDENWKRQNPILEIRLVGHTDDTGPEKYNVGLGNKRAQAVEQELAKLGVTRRVSVVVDPSPGETQPIADNTTTQGREQNRRVEVFATFKSLEPPRTICIDPARCVREPPGSVIKTGPPPYPDVPTGPPSKSPNERIDDILNRLPGKLAWVIRRAIVSGGCVGLEKVLATIVGSLDQREIDDLRAGCATYAQQRR